MKKYLVVKTMVSTFETEDWDWEPGEEPTAEGALELAKHHTDRDDWVEEEVQYTVDEV